MDKLDDKDKKLLAALKKNSRASLVSLGRDIGLSRSATHDRITRLEERGVIKGYTIDINDDFSPKTRAFLTVTYAGGAGNTVITKSIFSMPGIAGAYCLTGSIDAAFYCECDSTAELLALRDNIAEIPAVVDVHIRNLLTSHGSI